MIKISIYNLVDGEHPVDIQANVSDVPDIFPEFIGNINIKGNIRKLGKRYTLIANLNCTARLICDRSLKEFEQLISAELHLDYLADNYLFKINSNSYSYDDETIIISEDVRYIDLSEYVREALALNLPMKRVSPEYADKMFEEVFPEYSSKKYDINENIEISEFWDSLKNININ
jgi:uncharacterized protein